MSNADKLDVRLLRSEHLADLPFPASHVADFRIHFHPAAHGRAVAHAKESTSVEICGVLVGDWGQDSDGPFVRISEIIRCDSATKKFAEVTFTHDSWTQINREMDTKFTNLRIVGWYHSHPDFGIFLSDRDVFIQQNFFSGPGQVAFVVDPVRDAEGIFEWRDGKPALARHYWVGSRITGGEATARGGGQVGGPEAARGLSASIAASSPQEIPTSESVFGSRGSSLMVMLLGGMFFLLGYLLAGQRSRWEELRLIEGTVAHYGVWKGLRPGLEDGLSALRKELATVSDRVAVLSDEHIRLAGDGAKDKSKEWGQIRESLVASRQLLKQLEDQYALTSEEQNELLRLIARKLSDGTGNEAASRDAKLRSSNKLPASDRPQKPTSETTDSAKTGALKGDSPKAERSASALEKTGEP